MSRSYKNFVAIITYNGKQKHLGCFKTALEAKEVFDRYNSIREKEYAKFV